MFQHLKAVADKSDANKMTASNLGVVFGPTIFTAGDPMQNLQDISHLTKLVECIIVCQSLLFSEILPEPLSRSVSAEDDNEGVYSVVAIHDYVGGTEGADYHLPFNQGDTLEQVGVGDSVLCLL